MNYTLKIDPEFKDVIPPISSEEFEQLENNIVSEGMLLSPIITWNGYIVDGHNRYKILQKYPEIKYRTFEKYFEDKYEVISWICNNQIGTRNLSERYIRFLRAKQYEAEKNSNKFKGNQYTLAKESGGGKNCHHQKKPKTREIIAQRMGVSECEIKQAQQLYAGLTAAEEVHPGIMQDILSERINSTDKISKFRVDRIDNISITDVCAKSKPKDFEPVVYLKSLFSMYDGELQKVRLKCDADMMKVVIDRFGKSVNTFDAEWGKFYADVEISVSRTFFGWLFGFGGKIELVSPKNVRNDYYNMASEVIKSYRTNG